MKDVPAKYVALFAEALQLPRQERAAYLKRACTGDGELRRKIEGLLDSHDEAGDFLEQPPSENEGQKSGPGFEKSGDRIGRYKLLQQIGEGGCGIVYMAEQQEPVRRRVALKIIKPGMDTKNVMARFEAERQALALMDHPNIAKVFDAGATASGRPYFVMELVRGVKVTDYCDQNSLTTEERLGLFIQICRAVQHAHQKGIIHRDIKPSNILVTKTLEGAALPMVIDFGIAKATSSQRLTDKTLFTAFEMLIGTPAYMSPEQAEISGVDVDTRTDIYSLGVLLYELLTGSTPFDGQALMKAGLDEIRRVIREKEPQRPSTRLSTLAEADLTTAAQRRRSAPPALIRAIRGDLDWIVMKALEKDRTRRYETANGLALDVQRALENEPIAARPPSTVYKFQKSVLRHKLLFGGIGLLTIGPLASLAVVTASLNRERQARLKAQTEEARSSQMTRLLKDMLEGVGPSVARGRDTEMLREILDRTAARIEKEVVNQPLVETELRQFMGRLYFEIGNYPQAEKMHRATVSLNEKLYGAASAQAANSLNDLAQDLWKQGRLGEAETAHQSAFEIRTNLHGLMNADVATSLNGLAGVYRRQKRLAESEALTREALQIRSKLFPGDSLEVADSLHNLCVVLGDEGRREESEATARRMLAMRRRILGNEDVLVAAALVDLAWAVGFSGNVAEAESLEREALEMRRKLLGDEHPDVIFSLSSLGERLRQRGVLTEADGILRAAVAVQKKILSETHPSYLGSLRSLAITLEDEEKWPEAEAAHREAAQLWKKRPGDNEAQASEHLRRMIRCMIAQKKFTAAEQAFAEILTPSFVHQAASADFLGLRADLMARRGRWSEAAADATLALENAPGDPNRYHVLAPLLLKIHDQPGYDQLCRRIMGTFAETTNPFVADRMAKDCLLAPTSVTDLAWAGRMTDVALTMGHEQPSLAFFEVSKALSQYRSGNFTKAIEWANKAVETHQLHAQVQAQAVLAMSFWRLGKLEESRQSLSAGEILQADLVRADEGDLVGDSWLSLVFSRISLDEATVLIGSPTASPGSAPHP